MLKEKFKVKKKQTTLTRIENEIRFNSKLCRSLQVIQWILCRAILQLYFYIETSSGLTQRRDEEKSTLYGLYISHEKKSSDRAWFKWWIAGSFEPRFLHIKWFNQLKIAIKSQLLQSHRDYLRIFLQ